MVTEVNFDGSFYTETEMTGLYAYSQKDTLISQKTEELPDGNIYVEELYEIDQ